jgi:2-deoxystreptamine N-acetyl-D-glucosaminyltransferase/2-deoxystreptamine glucosyltransferase
MTDPRRVLVISYLPPTCGGIATWAGILRTEVDGRGVAFRFLEIPARRGRVALRRVAQAFDVVRLLARLLRELAGRRLDVVHVNCCLSPAGVWRDLAAALLASGGGLPVVAHYHGSLSDAAARLAPPSRFALRRLAGLASMNVGVTRESVGWLARRAPARAAYLPNFVEDRLAAGSGGAIRRSATRPRAIYVGRLSRDKGTFDLLRVAGRLPHVDFVLVGEILDEVRAALGAAPGNVRAVGVVSRDEVIERLRGSDVFVFPSHREGFPNAVLEAMAVGLPVVGTHVGAVADMIAEGQGGWLVAPGDVTALASAVDRLAADPGLARRMGAVNRHACAARYTVSAVFPRLEGVYESLTTRGRPSTEAERTAASAGQEA